MCIPNRIEPTFDAACTKYEHQQNIRNALPVQNTFRRNAASSTIESTQKFGNQIDVSNCHAAYHTCLFLLS